ncbi:hypothetical protein KKR91_01805 [Arthrobacter jiangjiafuii]|uniref:Tryptophan-rich sensory protein n=1 Tax=Arthrobacter jiangjiafuii TaxID=2817475 RepID=A0A975QZZ8_9MICC|nr:hypothetical protein [Arthrobacter jiangjiafuii]MBP3044755.1 hypothetical protein [Arthrobacter jiangjiafuii]QWC10415.1 hypothetical protein KKR91_01805 [Arthrobacter jiangjiafuii]
MSPGLVRRATVSAAAAATTGCALVQVFGDGGTLKDRGTLKNGTLEVLDPGGSLMAPAAVFWWLWLPVAALWLGYAVYQWLPRQRQNPRHNRLGWVVLAANTTALGWLMAVSLDSAPAVLSVAALQVAVGLTAVHLINREPAGSWTEGALTDVALGWFLALAVLTLTTALSVLLTGHDVDLGGWGGTVWTLVALISVTVGLTVVCMTDRGHLPVALAAAAGLVCVTVERLAGSPGSFVIASSAAGAAFLVVVSSGSRRHHVDHERRISARRSAGGNDDGVEDPGDTPGDQADSNSDGGADRPE